MFKPDYDRLSLIYEIAKDEGAGNIDMLLTIAHIKTNGFTFLSNGLFNERVDPKSSDEIEQIIRDSVNLWNSSVVLPCNIDIASEQIIKGSQYTNTHIRNKTYEFYKQLFE